MKTPILAFTLCFCATVCTAYAQQQSMPDMPGMDMGSTTPKQQAPSHPAKPNRKPEKADPHAPDMQTMGQDSGDRKAQAASRSEQNSTEQQSGQVGVMPGMGSDQSSTTIPTQELQEPEAIGFQTGKDLPAPELLQAVVQQQPMTLQNFMDLAMRNNPTLAEAQRDIDRSAQQARQVSLPPDPTIGYSGDHIRGGEYHGGEEGAFFSQTFVLGRKLALRRDIYRAEGQANQFARDVQLARVRNDVASTFFDTLAAQEEVVVQDRLLKTALDAETNAHELERVGQADASAVLNAEIMAEQAKVDFVNAQRTFLSHFTQLATYAGQTSLAPHPLTGSLVNPPEIDAEALVAADVQESPAVKQARAEVTVAEARLKSARRESIPNLNVQAGEWYSGETLSGTNIQAGPMSFAQAGVQLPLWNHNQGNKQAAEAELARANADVLRTQLWTRNHAEPYAQQYQTAHFTAERYRTEMLPRARRSYDLQVMKYQQMAQAYPEVVQAQHLLFSLQVNYVEALNQQWHAALALQNFVLMNGLDQPMSIGADTTSLNLPTGGGQ